MSINAFSIMSVLSLLLLTIINLKAAVPPSLLFEDAEKLGSSHLDLIRVGARRLELPPKADLGVPRFPPQPGDRERPGNFSMGKSMGFSGVGGEKFNVWHWLEPKWRQVSFPHRGHAHPPPWVLNFRLLYPHRFALFKTTIVNLTLQSPPPSFLRNAEDWNLVI